MPIGKLRHWLARRICRRYARDYLHVVDHRGLEWTLALIDEDVELHGDAFNHALHGVASSTTPNAYAGCRRYARDYLHVVDHRGLEWTLALIDEDVELHGDAFNHALHGVASSTTPNAYAGCRRYARDYLHVVDHRGPEWTLALIDEDVELHGDAFNHALHGVASSTTPNAYAGCRRYARDYLHVVDRRGPEWTLALIDEDVELHGDAFNHALHGLASSTTPNGTARHDPAIRTRQPAVPQRPIRLPIRRGVLGLRLRPRRPGGRAGRLHRSHRRHLVLALQPGRPPGLPFERQPGHAGLS